LLSSYSHPPHVKLLDFDVAQLTSSDADATLTAAGDVIGTPAYMSPEQAAGKPLDARSDVLSFGAVLYEPIAALGSPPATPPRRSSVPCYATGRGHSRHRPWQHLTEERADVTASIAVPPFAI